jgi:hypothetical protein
MSKPLVRPQRSSSVAGILDPGIGARALEKPADQIVSILPTPIERPHTTPIFERPVAKTTAPIETINRQFILTKNSDKILKEIVSIYGEATGLEIKHSEWLRSVLIAVAHALPELKREASAIGKLKRPKNEKSNREIQEIMERKIAKAFVAGMRAVSSLE